MALEVEDAIIHPFLELVERGKEAVTNAEAARMVNPDLSEVMLKSARAAIREGERALQRVQPLVLGHLERYGDCFRDAIRDHDGLFESRRQLEDVLYDLDDFIQMDTFDAAKFIEVQAASKAFALTATDTIKRLRIDDPFGRIATPQRSRFPPLPPIPSPIRVEPLAIPRPSTRTGYRPQHQYHHSIDHSSMGYPSRSSPQLKRVLSNSLRSSPGDSEEVLRMMSNKKYEKSLAPSTGSSDSQYSQPSFQWSLPSDNGQKGMHSHQPSDYSDLVGAEVQTLLSEPQSPRIPEECQETASMASAPWTTAWVHDQAGSAGRPSFDESISLNGSTDQTEKRTAYVHRPLSMTMSVPDSASQLNSVPDSFSPAPLGHRSSMFSTSNSRMSFMKHTPTSSSTSAAQRITSLATIHSEAAFPPEAFVPPEEPIQPYARPDLGERRPSSPTLLSLQPVSPPIQEPARPSKKSRAHKVELHKPIWYTRQENCNIGHKSSLYELKGFCDGSVSFRDGRMQEATKNSLMLDQSSVNVHNSSLSAATCSSNAIEYIPMTASKPATQCAKCDYRHPTVDLKRDMSQIRAAKMSEEGVFFRLRFLYKSHLSQSSKSGPMYGCLFCSQLGHTTREGDATVFTSQQHLFRHLSHHAQPLPEISGVKVLYGEVRNNAPDAGDFDLHFPDPPYASLITAESSLLAKRPTAVAIKSHMQKEGDRPLTDPDGRREVLQFLIGANIVGIEFPEVWGGKWCFGWHDGVRGAFPSKLIALDPPPKGEIRLPGTNYDGVSVTTKWKWVPPSPNTGWLAFDKNTTLINVSWLGYDSWCWSGMTKGGKVGFFPASHIKAESIRDTTGEFGAPLAKKDNRRLFKMRRSRSISSHNGN